MGSIALNVFTDRENIEDCGTQPLVLHVAEFKREMKYQSNLKLVSLLSSSASELENGVLGRGKSPRQTLIEDRTQTFQSHSCDPPHSRDNRSRRVARSGRRFCGPRTFLVVLDNKEAATYNGVMPTTQVRS